MSTARKALDADDFEARYRADPDPWRYETSRYEHDKYHATLAACGPGPFESAVELGGSIGMFSSLLAPRCRRLTTLDFSPTAVGLARARLAGLGNVEALLGRIPEDLPAGRFDLLVASEVLYYLTGEEVGATIEWAGAMLKPGARIVCVHWRAPGADRPLTAETVHAAIGAAPTLIWTTSQHTADYLLDTYERV